MKHTPTIFATPDPGEANAHLIAAAPELLALAERIVAHGMSFPKYERDLAIAAILKAKGETPSRVGALVLEYQKKRHTPN